MSNIINRELTIFKTFSETEGFAVLKLTSFSLVYSRVEGTFIYIFYNIYKFKKALEISYASSFVYLTVHTRSMTVYMRIAVDTSPE